MFSHIPAIDALLFINVTMSIFAIVSCALRRYDIMSISLMIALFYTAFIGICFFVVKYYV